MGGKLKGKKKGGGGGEGETGQSLKAIHHKEGRCIILSFFFSV